MEHLPRHPHEVFMSCPFLATCSIVSKPCDREGDPVSISAYSMSIIYIYIYIIPLNIKCLTFLPLHVWLARVMSRRRSRTHCMPGDRTMPMTVLSHLSAAVRAAVRASSVYLATPLSELEHSCATTGEGVEQTQPTWKIRASTDASL